MRLVLYRGGNTAGSSGLHQGGIQYNPFTLIVLLVILELCFNINIYHFKKLIIAIHEVSFYMSVLQFSFFNAKKNSFTVHFVPDILYKDMTSCLHKISYYQGEINHVHVYKIGSLRVNYFSIIALRAIEIKFSIARMKF